jgi:hypothetical protein
VRLGHECIGMMKDYYSQVVLPQEVSVWVYDCCPRRSWCPAHDPPPDANNLQAPKGRSFLACSEAVLTPQASLRLMEEIELACERARSSADMAAARYPCGDAGANRYYLLSGKAASNQASSPHRCPSCRPGW